MIRVNRLRSLGTLLAIAVLIVGAVVAKGESAKQAAETRADRLIEKGEEFIIPAVTPESTATHSAGRETPSGASQRAPEAREVLPSAHAAEVSPGTAAMTWVQGLLAVLLAATLAALVVVGMRAEHRHREVLQQVRDEGVEQEGRLTQAVLGALENLSRAMNVGAQESERWFEVLQHELGSLKVTLAESADVVRRLEAQTATAKPADAAQSSPSLPLLASDSFARTSFVLRTYLQRLGEEIQVARATDAALSSLPPSDERAQLASALAPYVEMAQSWRDLDQRLTNAEKEEHVPPATDATLWEAACGLRAAASRFSEKHRREWLLGVIDLLRRTPSHEVQARSLLDLLDLEEIPVPVGSEVTAALLEEVDPVVEGTGTRRVIVGVIGAGYRDRTTRRVLRKPTVAVQLRD